MKSVLILLAILLFSIPAFSQLKEAQQIDEFGSTQCDDYLSHMDMITGQYRNEPTARIYFIIYEGKIGGSLPRVGEARTKLASIKKWLVSRKISLNRFVFINGGFKESFKVQVWQVPERVLPPKVSPTLDRMRHRKGKPTGYCLWCEC